MMNMVVRAFTCVVGWFVQVTGEKLLNDKLDEFTNKRCRLDLDGVTNSLKSQLRRANTVILTAHETEITNKYLLLSVKNLEERVRAATKMLDNLGSCYCDESCADRSSEIKQEINRMEEIKQEKNGISRYNSERNIITWSQTGKQSVSCEVCCGDTDNNRAKRRKLNGDDSSCKMREIMDQLRETGDHVQGALQLEMLSSLARETRSVSKKIEAAICEDRKLKFVQETREVSHRKIDPTKEAGIVGRLSPRSNIKNLKITGYDGSVIPPTPLDSNIPDLNNLETLHLKDFMNLRVLPPLGQLPHLKKLYLENFPAVKEVTSEFYGRGTIFGFPSLREFSLHELPECETWAGSDNCHIFPRLEKLTLTSCPKLKGLPCDCGSDDGCCLPKALRKLFIYDCPKLTLPASPHAHVLSEASTSE